MPPRRAKMSQQEDAMESFVFWLNRPFRPGRISRKTRRGTRVVAIRYRGSLGRSAVKTLIVLALLAVMSNVFGERPARNLGAKDVASEVGGAATLR